MMSSFFFWTAWSAAANRPGDEASYTNNWPHEPLVGNRPTGDNVVWTGVSIIMLLAGISAMAWWYASRKEEDETAGLPLDSDPLARWEVYYGCAAVAVALFLAPLFTRILIAGDADHEIQGPSGTSRMVDQLWSTEGLEIVDDGGRYPRVERTRRISAHPVAQRTLRVCWENPGGAYNCGQCRKCLLTMITLEALGVRAAVRSFPTELDLSAVAAIEISQKVLLTMWEDVLDAARAAGRVDLETAVEAAVERGRRGLDLPPGYRRRHTPGPAATVRIAAVVPAWRQSRYLAAAVASALDQRILTGVGVVIVNDGCPEPNTDRIAQALRDADPHRVAYVRQPNQGVSAARNAGIRRAFARWPQIEAVFPLDADNMLSAHTLAMLRDTLAARPDAAWAAPTLEFFGAEEGEWRMPEPFLAYRQLFNNQTDTGSLIRRSVFEAGIEFDESIRGGYEDWDFFLRAALAGFVGIHAGRCGFRYRQRPDSMLSDAQQRSGALEAELRRRHRDAYRPGELARREHAEAPRFALVRCGLDDVLLTAACDLEPHRIPLTELLRRRRNRADAPPWRTHVPAITVLATAATLDQLGSEGLLAEALMRLQMRLRDHAIVGLAIERRPGMWGRLLRRSPQVPSTPAALAMRTRTLAKVASAGDTPQAEEMVVLKTGRRGPAPLPRRLVEEVMSKLAPAAPDSLLVPPSSHAEFFEYMHLDLGDTTQPLSDTEDAADAARGMPS